MSWSGTNDIGRIQIEITNYCNAQCPLCTRNDLKNKLGDGYLNNTFMPLEIIKKRFIPGEWDSLHQINLCANIDEPTTHPDIFNIIKYFKTLNNRVQITIATNGGIRSEQFWNELGGCSRVIVTFGIDGLEDTNHIYRKRVNWNKLQRNYRAYISAGGNAEWQFIPFEWNEHQLEDVRAYARKEGFRRFKLIKTSRL